MIQTKVLVINMNYLGDALMTTPAIRVLKRHFQQVEIDVIAGATNSYGALEILSLDPDIDHLIARVDGGSLARGWQLLKVISKGKVRRCSRTAVSALLQFDCETCCGFPGYHYAQGKRRHSHGGSHA